MGTQEDRQRILQMLAKGTISVEEAEQLLSSLPSGTASATSGTADTQASSARKAPPKYLRVVVEPKAGSDNDRVNIRVPMQLLRAGAKLTALLPDQARTQINAKLGEKGINLDLGKLSPEDLESLMNELSELTVDVDGKDETVRIFCE